MSNFQFRNQLIGTALLVAFLVVGEYVNRPFRFYLKETFSSVPYWADHILFMLTAKLLFAVIIGSWLVGWSQLNLSLPQGKRPLAIGALVGIALAVLIGGVLQLLGFLQFQLNPEPLLMIGNIFSNGYEEFIYRGVALAAFLKYFKYPPVAVLLSSVVFTQGHFHNPWLLVALVFVSGAVWCMMTLRFKSIWPAYVSHCFMDFVADTIFKF